MDIDPALLFDRIRRYVW